MNCIKSNLLNNVHLNIYVNYTMCIRSVTSIPRAKSIPIIGNTLDLLIGTRVSKLHEYIDNRHKKLGKIFIEKLGSSDLIFTSDAKLMKSMFINLEGKYPMHVLPEAWILYNKLYESKRGLFFMNGEEWLQNRRLLNKHLLRENTDSWIKVPVKHTINSLIKRWKAKETNETTIEDVTTEFYNLSTNVLIQVMVGSKVLPQTKYYDELLSMFSLSVKRIFETSAIFHGLPPHWCQRLNLKVWRDFKESVDQSLYFGNKISKELLRMGDSDGLIKKLVDENMDDDVISRIVTDFIIAAGDTTAYTSLWIFYLLSRNPKQILEIREKDRNYIPFVIREAMRLYPVAPFITRILPQDCQLGQYQIKAMTPIVASIYTSGRDPQYFTDPEKFLPYRWDRNDKRKESLLYHEPSASLPFAMGTRSCIGKRIAMIQLTELIQQVVDNFDFECPNTENIKAITSMTLVPNKKIALKLKACNQ